MKSAAAPLITLNLAELGALAQGKPIRFRIAGQTIELSFDQSVTPRMLVGLMMDIITNGKPEVARDPPEAAEFLPLNRRNRRKPR